MRGKLGDGQAADDGHRDQRRGGEAAPGKQSLTEMLGRPMEAMAPGKRARADAIAPPAAGQHSEGADPEAATQPLTTEDAAAITDAGGLPPAVTAAIETEAGEPLPDAAQWSKRMQVDLSGARVVRGPKAARAAASIHAAAFTVGHRVFLGAGVSPSDQEVMRHELTHVAQQRGAPMPAARDLELTAPGDHVEHEARGEVSGAQIAPTGHAAIAPIGLFGQMGPGGGGGILPGPKNPQIDAFHYFEKHGKAHFKELVDMKMGDMTLDTGSPFATWAAGNAKGFLDKLSSDLFANATKPYNLAEKTLVPASVSQLIDTGRDAANPDDPEKANEYHLGVTLELQKAYRERLHDALERLMPRLVKEWNRRTLADQAARQNGATVAIPEHPETNQPGVGILQSHPIDRFVLGALWSLTTPTLRPNFTAYRKAFPEQAKPSGPRDARPVVDTLRKVKFQWQSPNQARHWIKVTDPVDASPEEVAQELFGDTQLTYLVTPRHRCSDSTRAST